MGIKWLHKSHRSPVSCKEISREQVANRLRSQCKQGYLFRVFICKENFRILGPILFKSSSNILGGTLRKLKNDGWSSIRNSANSLSYCPNWSLRSAESQGRTQQCKMYSFYSVFYEKSRVQLVHQLKHGVLETERVAKYVPGSCFDFEMIETQEIAWGDESMIYAKCFIISDDVVRTGCERGRNLQQT